MEVGRRHAAPPGTRSAPYRGRVASQKHSDVFGYVIPVETVRANSREAEDRNRKEPTNQQVKPSQSVPAKSRQRGLSRYAGLQSCGPKAHRIYQSFHNEPRISKGADFRQPYIAPRRRRRDFAECRFSRKNHRSVVSRLLKPIPARLAICPHSVLPIDAYSAARAPDFCPEVSGCTRRGAVWSESPSERQILSPAAL